MNKRSKKSIIRKLSSFRKKITRTIGSGRKDEKDRKDTSYGKTKENAIDLSKDVIDLTKDDKDTDENIRTQSSFSMRPVSPIPDRVKRNQSNNSIPSFYSPHVPRSPDISSTSHNEQIQVTSSSSPHVPRSPDTSSYPHNEQIQVTPSSSPRVPRSPSSSSSYPHNERSQSSSSSSPRVPRSPDTSFYPHNEINQASSSSPENNGENSHTLRRSRRDVINPFIDGLYYPICNEITMKKINETDRSELKEHKGKLMFYHYTNYDTKKRPEGFAKVLNESLCQYPGCNKMVQISLPLCRHHLKDQYHIEVKESGIREAGYGLFTTKKIKHTRTRLFTYDGEIIDKNIMNSRYANEKSFAPYVFQTESGVIIDAALNRHFSSFINHAPDSEGNEKGKANLCAREDEEDGKIGIFTLRDINKGEELLMSYGNPPSISSMVTYGTCVIPKLN